MNETVVVYSAKIPEEQFQTYGIFKCIRFYKKNIYIERRIV